MHQPENVLHVICVYTDDYRILVSITKLTDNSDIFTKEDEQRHQYHPYKHFCVLHGWPPSGEWQYSGGRGGHLFTSSGPLVDHW